MGSSGKSVDPILIGIIVLGVVGLVVFYWLSTRIQIAALPPVEQPPTGVPTAPQMQGNAAVWGPAGGQNQGFGGGAPSGGMGVAPPVPGAAAPASSGVAL